MEKTLNEMFKVVLKIKHFQNNGEDEFLYENAYFERGIDAHSFAVSRVNSYTEAEIIKPNNEVTK